MITPRRIADRRLADEPEIAVMRQDDKGHRRYQEPNLVMVPDLLAEQQGHAQRKHEYRPGAPVVLSPSMVERIEADRRGQDDHEHFKIHIVNDVDPEDGQGLEEKGKQCAVNGAGQRSTDA